MVITNQSRKVTNKISFALSRYSVLLLLLLSVSTVNAEIIWVGVKDPNIKDALFDAYQGRHFSAITRLQMAQKLGRVLDQEQAGLVDDRRVTMGLCFFLNSSFVASE